jgi:NADH-quinone oxidoreductase subunit H
MFYLIAFIKVAVLMGVVLSIVPVLIWWERKGSAYIQDRRGPNRANILGIKLGGFIQNFPDAVKLLFKEEIIPAGAHRFLYLLAPVMAVTITVSVAAVIPFSAPIRLGATVFTTQVADLNVGVLYILAVSSLSVYGLLLGGWASGGGYSTFGGIRAASQMISYEAAMGLAMIGVVLYAGSARPDEIVALQGASVLDWNIFRQPLAFLIFLTCAFAETNRNPFDLPEGESEIVGYHVEYSSMKFALFFMAEYAHIVIASMIIAVLFLGGWQVPFVSTEGLLSVLGFLGPANSVAGALIQAAVFMLKVLFICWFFIWVRWTLPRFRYDQLMGLGWKVLLPLAMINLIVTGFIILV